MGLGDGCMYSVRFSEVREQIDGVPLLLRAAGTGVEPSCVALRFAAISSLSSNP